MGIHAQEVDPAFGAGEDRRVQAFPVGQAILWHLRQRRLDGSKENRLVQLPTGFIDLSVNGFYIITRPVYHDLVVSIAQRDPETMLAENVTAPRPGPMEGRGVLMELDGKGSDRLLLKKSRRGGLYGKLKGDIYRSDYESISEIFLTESAWKKGVPVALIAFVMTARAGEGRLASYWRGYSASIKVTGGRSLGDWLSSSSSGKERGEVLVAAAEAIKRAHGRGFEHGDLNLGNLLVAKSEQGDFSGWLIDLSHSTLGGVLPFKRRLGNLVRLYRSAEKWFPAGTPEEAYRRRRDIVRFLQAYTDHQPGEMRNYFRAAERYRTSLFMHRLGWKVGRTGGGGKISRRPDPAER